MVRQDDFSQHGFQLINTKYIAEVNSECYYLEHVKSGAKLFKIANDDENKTFSIAFRTLPDSDNGIAHIMEHGVLNGSINFPVKSPFDILSQGSLNTFLNAMTSRDLTQYPVASLNEKDFFNLMHVYLDAVFNPLLLDDPRILRQEGWHYELVDKNEKLRYNGVVYNEMKGAFSNPYRLLHYYNLKSLFPDNSIGKESGGLPESIVTLTQAEFVNFHRQYYHPSNAFIFLYGNGSLEKELKFIDEKYLNRYRKQFTPPSLKLQRGFEKMREEQHFYPIPENEPTEQKTFLCLNFVVGESADYALSFALNVLCEVVFNQESSTIKKVIREANDKQTISAFVSDFQQNVLTIIVQNSDTAEAESCKQLILNTLEKEIRKGIDTEELRAVLNRMEFSIREGNDAQKGITYFSQIKSGWLYADNPFVGLEYEAYLDFVKSKIETDYFEKLIEDYILRNNHASFIVMTPKAGLEVENQKLEEERLESYKNSLSDEEIEQLITETKALLAFQNEENSPENIAKIPMLSLEDINPTATFHTCKVKKLGKNKLLHYEDFTNGIIYSYLFFNLQVIPQKLIPYAALLSNITGLLNTEKYSYGELQRELNNHSGGFSTYTSSFLSDKDVNALSTYFVVSSKFLSKNCKQMNRLLTEILLKSLLDDEKRLKEVLLNHFSEVNNLILKGYSIARTRVHSYFSPEGAFDEIASGIHYYNFINDFMHNLDKKLPIIIKNLKNVIETLFTKENLFIAVTCDKNDFSTYKTAISEFFSSLPDRKQALQMWNFEFTNKNEGIQTSSKVQYVVAGYNYRKLGYEWNGKMHVLNQILSTDWLKNQIRIQGGAYGGFSSISPNGSLLFSSFRDPNLSKTLNIFKKTADFVRNFDADKQQMTRFIIGTIAYLDTPQTIEQKGLAAFYYHLLERTLENLQNDREAVLNVTPDDIRQFAPMLDEIIEQNYFCVYGNERIIETEKEIFKNIFYLKK